MDDIESLEDSVTLLSLAEQLKGMSTTKLAEMLVKQPFDSLSEEV